MHSSCLQHYTHEGNYNTPLPVSLTFILTLKYVTLKTRLWYLCRNRFPSFQDIPVECHSSRIVVGSDQEMCHVGQDSHQLVSVNLPFGLEVPEVLRHKSNHVKVLLVGLQGQALSLCTESQPISLAHKIERKDICDVT